MENTRVAVIGLGSIAQLVHLPNLVKLPNVEVTAVAEINKNRLNVVADKFGVEERYRDYHELLENSDVDAVIIATPTNAHKEPAIAALKAKKFVLVEKPLARTYDEAKQIYDAAKKSKADIMVGMNLRFRPDAMLLRSILNSGEIGKPYYIKANWIRRQSSSGKWFTRKEESGGGAVLDLGILLLDLSLWLLDYPQIESVNSKSFSINTRNVEDTAVSMLKFKNNTLINMEVSWSLPVEKDQFNLTIYGTEGFASLNPFRISKKMNDQFLDLTPSQRDSAVNLFKKSYLNELKSFLGSVRGLNPIFSSGEEAVSRMKIVEAMYKSANENTEVKL